jgi:hypothetical protein
LLFYSLNAVIAGGVAIVGLAGGHLIVILLGISLAGFGLGVTVVEDTILQSRVAKEYLGRVYSVGTLVAFALLPVGYLLAGIIARRIGADAVLLIGAVIGLLVSALLGYSALRHRRATPDVADT